MRCGDEGVCVCEGFLMNESVGVGRRCVAGIISGFVGFLLSGL